MPRGRYKLVLLGESGTGKSTLAQRLYRNRFNERIDQTIGASFFLLEINGIKYELWDTAGQERYRSLISTYYRGADVILLVYDMDDLQTLEKLNYFYGRIEDEATIDHKIIVIGNKCDLLSFQETSAVARQVKKMFPHKEIETIFTSAKSGYNCGELQNLIEKCAKSLNKPEDPLHNVEITNYGENKSSCPCSS